MVFALISTSALAQDRTVSGKVTGSDDGLPLPGVNILLKGTTTGVPTNADGEYRISVPDGATLIFRYLGYVTQEIVVGSQTVINVSLAPDATSLGEVVVTGVAAGTSTKKLGFDVAKVDTKVIQEVPGVDPGNALRGKVAGVRITQPSGDPGAAAQIRIRGSNSINGSQSPLIIVDGIITNGNLRDINAEDIASIELVKGAAASSLYGSLAANGVVQIITKRGSSDDSGIEVTVRNEYGWSGLVRKYPLSNLHRFAPFSADTHAAGVTPLFGFSYDAGGNPIEESIRDNPYADSVQLFDNQDRFFTSQPFYNNYISLGGKGDNFNYHLSFQNQHQQGVIEFTEPFERQNLRLNMDYLASEKFTIQLSSSFTTTNRQRQVGGFRDFLSVPPFIDLLERDENGEISPTPDGHTFNEGYANSIYELASRTNTESRNRFLGGITLKYDLTDKIKLEASTSLDQTWREFVFYEPKDYVDAQNVGGERGGFYQIINDNRKTRISSAQATWSETFGKFNLRTVLKYQLEERDFLQTRAEGTRFVGAGDVLDLASLDPEQLFIDNTITRDVAENVFFDVSADYDDKIIFGGLIRRDGSSLFGEENRYVNYGRGFLAYRITEDVDINNIQELKVRASFGTSGLRPPVFNAQYEILNSGVNGISKIQTGNRELLPSIAEELEVGVNMDFLDRFSFIGNYSVTNVRNDFINAPLPAASGFQNQWQNVGELRSTALEFSLNGTAFRNEDMVLDFGFNWDKITQEITDLGDIPAFTRSTYFRVEEGQPYGTMYGQQLLTSVDQIKTDANGNVLATQFRNLPAGNWTPSDFSVNEFGHVVHTASIGTAAEQAGYIVDDAGQLVAQAIGDTNPDWNIGFNLNFAYKDFNVYALVEHQQGGDIYNNTAQLIYFEENHGDLDTYGLAGKHVNYSNSASALYNGANATSYFVEDGTFTKLREVAIAYTLRGSKIGWDWMRDAKLAVTGRNLFTWTDYSGFDPEVSLNGNATNFRVDQFVYPQYRTYTVSLQLRF